MGKYFAALVVSVLGTVVLQFLAGMAGGMCHCMTSTYTLFPFGSMIEMHSSWETLGFLLTMFQFPIYTIIVMVLRSTQARVIAATVIAAIHAVGAWIALTFW